MSLRKLTIYDQERAVPEKRRASPSFPIQLTRKKYKYNKKNFFYEKILFPNIRLLGVLVGGGATKLYST